VVAQRAAVVILPVYNEAKTVADVLAAVKRVHNGEIIVVDDGSSDSTPQILAGIDGIRVEPVGKMCFDPSLQRC